MTITYRIDQATGTVFSRAHGSPTRDDLIGFLRELKDDARFEPHFRLLFDFREVSDMPLFNNDIQSIAESDVFGPGSRRALVVGNDLVYGLARMFEVYAEAPEQELVVFRDMDSARRWLGLPEA